MKNNLVIELINTTPVVIAFSDFMDGIAAGIPVGTFIKVVQHDEYLLNKTDYGWLCTRIHGGDMDNLQTYQFDSIPDIVEFANQLQARYNES